MAATAASIGLEGLLVAVLLSGAMLVVLGALRIGSLVRYIPHAVTVGFTSGIAVTILASQLKDLGGLRLAGAEPGPIIPKLGALAHAASTFNIDAFAVGALTGAFAYAAWKFWALLLPLAMLAGLVVMDVKADKKG